MLVGKKRVSGHKCVLLVGMEACLYCTHGIVSLGRKRVRRQEGTSVGRRRVSRWTKMAIGYAGVRPAAGEKKFN